MCIRDSRKTEVFHPLDKVFKVASRNSVEIVPNAKCLTLHMPHPRLLGFQTAYGEEVEIFCRFEPLGSEPHHGIDIVFMFIVRD